MLNYIATPKTSMLIQKICKDRNILILHETKELTDIVKYIKQTKVNFNLVKYFIIELSCLENEEKDIIQSIYTFSRLYNKTRIIILAQGLDNQSNILNELYNREIYNIINSNSETEITEEIIKCFSVEGIQKKEAKKFEKIEKVETKENKIEKVISFIKNKKIKEKQSDSDKQNDIVIHQPKGVYFFALLLEAITRLTKLIAYIVVFILTSIGITILLNSELRNMVFQILGLK